MKLKQKLEEFDRGPMWTPAEGPNYIRVLPPWNQLGLFFKETKFHWNMGDKPFACRKAFGLPDCFLCEVADKSKEKNKAFEGAVRARKRFYINIVDLNDLGSGVQVYSCGVNVIRDIASYIADPKWGDITDINEGRNITLVRKGKGRDSRFSLKADPDKTQISSKVLDHLVDLDKLVQPASNEAMQLAFNKFGGNLMAQVTSSENLEATPALPDASSKDIPFDITPSKGQEDTSNDAQASEPEKESAPETPPVKETKSASPSEQEITDKLNSILKNDE